MTKNRTFEEKESLRKSAQAKSFDVLQRRLDLMSALLHSYGEKIKEIQGVRHNSLYPAFSVCKAGQCCLGCLHIEWVRYFDPKKDQKKRHSIHGKPVGEKVIESAFYSEKVKNVLQRLPRGDEHYELRETIKSFEKVREARASMVKRLTNALQATFAFDC